MADNACQEAMATPFAARIRSQMSKSFITYWLKHNNKYVFSVRAPRGLPERTVRFLAVSSHDRIPLPDYPFETLRERRFRIMKATVETFEDERTDLFPRHSIPKENS